MSADVTSSLEDSREVIERSLWLGTTAHPIFARITTPTSSPIRGGVLISPPIGRESRAARWALRTLATSLARDGFAVLRYDHFGTGDSSGDFDDDTFFVEWTDDVRRGVDFLRSMGASSVSALGMRLGATILGRAAQLHELDLTSAVFWDPCESGRSYLRERTAFEAATQEDDRDESARSNERSEFVYRPETKEKMRTLTLLEVDPERLAHRILIVTRGDRVTPGKLQRQFESDSVQWESTDELSALLEVELPFAKQPDRTLRQIQSWISESRVDESPLLATSATTASNVCAGPGPMSVRERVIDVGPRGLFAIVSEPVGEVLGPWIVMVNGANEDHVGPSRLWVDLSRRWSSFGFRCVRFDFAGLGESPRPTIHPPTGELDNSDVRDICSVIQDLSPNDTSNAVFIGLCSGAHVALRAALQLHSRGVCTMNPQVSPAILRTAERLEESEHHLFRSMRSWIKGQPWIGKLIWQLCRVALPTAYSLKVRRALARDGTEMLLVVSPQDVIPFPRVPILRSLDKRRLISTEMCRIEIVADMDHDLLNSEGRAKAVAILNDHIMKKFAT